MVPRRGTLREEQFSVARMPDALSAPPPPSPLSAVAHPCGSASRIAPSISAQSPICISLAAPRHCTDAPILVGFCLGCTHRRRSGGAVGQMGVGGMRQRQQQAPLLRPHMTGDTDAGAANPYRASTMFSQGTGPAANRRPSQLSLMLRRPSAASRGSARQCLAINPRCIW
jgi:hypothetical protein